MNLIYTTREGAKWTVTNCRPHEELPDFLVGRREPDGQRVTVHVHRCVVADTSPQPSPQSGEGEEANAS